MKSKQFGRYFRHKGQRYYTGGFDSKEALETAIKSVKKSIDEKSVIGK